MSFANSILYVRTIQPIRLDEDRVKNKSKDKVIDGDSPKAQKHLEEIARYEE